MILDTIGDVRTIWSFPFPHSVVDDDRLDIVMPSGARILTLQAQGHMPTLWALVESLAPKTVRRFRIIGTGHEVPWRDQDLGVYVGTWQYGGFAWHLFDLSGMPD